MTLHKQSIIKAFILFAFAVAMVPTTLYADAGMTSKGEGQKFSYSEVKPFVDLFTNVLGTVKSSTVSVSKQSENADVDLPEAKLSALTQFVVGQIRAAKGKNGTQFIDQGFTAVNDELTLCLKGEFPKEESDKLDVPSMLFCQNFRTNALNKVVIEDEDGNEVARYTLEEYETSK